MNGALPEDNIYYYIAYAIILFSFYFVLKSPKKSDKEENKSKQEDEK
jgi:hypothetical protein